MIKRILPAMALMAVAGSVEALQPQALFQHETVMAQAYQARAKVVLPSAPIRYLDDDNHQGYASGGEIELVGRTRRVVLDHPPADSDLSIIDHYRSRLTAAGYRVAFECQQDDCGDAAGWRLTFGKGVIGDSANQHYLLAHKGGQAERGDYVAVYVNEVDDLPRSVAVSVEKARLTDVRSLAAQPGEQKLFFALNNSQLSLADLLRVDQVATALRQRDDLRADITGYADGAGDAASENGRDRNRRLARARADRVAAWLTEHGAGDRVGNLGGQVQVPPPGESGGQWRRVDLVLESQPEPAPAADDQAATPPAAPAPADEGNNQSQGDQVDETDSV